jgi:hypothetical protein
MYTSEGDAARLYTSNEILTEENYFDSILS